MEWYRSSYFNFWSILTCLIEKFKISSKHWLVIKGYKMKIRTEPLLRVTKDSNASCLFLLYNLKYICPCLPTQAFQVLVQSPVISRLDYGNSFLAGRPLNAVQHLHLNQNAAAWLSKFSHTTPLLHSHHWLPVAPASDLKHQYLPTKPKTYQCPLTSEYHIPSSLLVLLDWFHLLTSYKEVMHLFSVLAPRWWNKFPPIIQLAETMVVFQQC